jgi:protein TonB
MKYKIKHILFLIVTIFMFTSLCSQERDTLTGEHLDSLINSGQICFDPVPEDAVANEEEVFIADPVPSFPGGEVAFKKWLSDNVKYPNIPRESQIQGTVFLRFEVTKTGDIGDVEIMKSIDPLLDEEAIRIIRSLPKFEPAIIDGKPITTWMFSPIKFELN